MDGVVVRGIWSMGVLVHTYLTCFEREASRLRNEFYSSY